MIQHFHKVFVASLGLLLVAGCETLPVEEASVASASAALIDSSVIDQALEGMVDEGRIAGVSALVYVDGEEAYFGEAGFADRESGLTWQRDTHASIFSMTKPVTGVTLMTLYEEGLFDLDAPLSQYLPEFADVRVVSGMTDDGAPILAIPDQPIRVIDLFRYTACFGYGWEDHPAAAAMRAANVLDPTKPLAQFSQELAQVPLFCQPGEAWKYGVAVDVQARLAEVVSGEDFETLITDRVLAPLGMTQTSYYLSPEDRTTLAAVYNRGENGALTRVPDNEVYAFSASKPVQINGGHGLISTLSDYILFAEMLRGQGSLGDVQILKPETVAMMTTDQLSEDIVERDFLPSKGQVGFGFNLAVRTAPPLSDGEPFGVTGEYFWDGAASTLFWVDPQNKLSAVFFVQIFPFDGAVQADFRRAVYEAFGVETRTQSENELGGRQ